jgi:hypothetical protein
MEALAASRSLKLFPLLEHDCKELVSTSAGRGETVIPNNLSSGSNDPSFQLANE